MWSNRYACRIVLTEQVLNDYQMFAAARTKDIPATIVRMGQACGPKATGAWGTTEWMPILVKSSVALACLPGLTGVRPPLI